MGNDQGKNSLSRLNEVNVPKIHVTSSKETEKKKQPRKRKSSKPADGNPGMKKKKEKKKVEKKTAKPISEDILVNARYKLISEVGEGAFGVVYHVHDVLDNNKSYALKCCKFAKGKKHDDEEEKVAKRLRHKGCIEVYRSFILDKRPDAKLADEKHDYYCMIMEWANGGDLCSLLEEGKLEFGVVVRIFIQLLDTLNYIHAKNVLHRDIKPDNIMITFPNDKRNLEEIQIKIGDFGRGKKMDYSKNAYTPIHGCPGMFHFMPPELLDINIEKYDCRADMWSLGLILFLLLSGVTVSSFSKFMVKMGSKNVRKDPRVALFSLMNLIPSCYMYYKVVADPDDFQKLLKEEFNQTVDITSQSVLKLMLCEYNKRISSEELSKHPIIEAWRYIYLKDSTKKEEELVKNPYSLVAMISSGTILVKDLLKSYFVDYSSDIEFQIFDSNLPMVMINMFTKQCKESKLGVDDYRTMVFFFEQLHRLRTPKGAKMFSKLNNLYISSGFIKIIITVVEMLFKELGLDKLGESVTVLLLSFGLDLGDVLREKLFENENFQHFVKLLLILSDSAQNDKRIAYLAVDKLSDVFKLSLLFGNIRPYTYPVVLNGFEFMRPTFAFNFVSAMKDLNFLGIPGFGDLNNIPFRKRKVICGIATTAIFKYLQNLIENYEKEEEEKKNNSWILTKAKPVVMVLKSFVMNIYERRAVCSLYGSCSFNFTGDRYLMKILIHCDTCWPGKKFFGACEQCAYRCHNGHKLILLSKQPSTAYCDCFESGKCKCSNFSAKVSECNVHLSNPQLPTAVLSESSKFGNISINNRICSDIGICISESPVCTLTGELEHLDDNVKKKIVSGVNDNGFTVGYFEVDTLMSGDAFVGVIYKKRGEEEESDETDLKSVTRIALNIGTGCIHYTNSQSSSGEEQNEAGNNLLFGGGVKEEVKVFQYSGKFRPQETLGVGITSKGYVYFTRNGYFLPTIREFKIPINGTVDVFALLDIRDDCATLHASFGKSGFEFSHQLIRGKRVESRIERKRDIANLIDKIGNFREYIFDESLVVLRNEKCKEILQKMRREMKEFRDECSKEIKDLDELLMIAESKPNFSLDENNGDIESEKEEEEDGEEDEEKDEEAKKVYCIEEMEAKMKEFDVYLKNLKNMSPKRKKSKKAVKEPRVGKKKD